MFGLGIWELLIILLALILLFGSSRIPKLARSLGQAIGSFKSASASSDELRLVEDTDKKERT